MTPCRTCGQPHPGCTAHTKNGPNTGGPCKKPCRPGEVCTSHGGRAPQVRAAATRRREHAAATEQVRTLGLQVDISPTDALLQEVQWTAGHVHWLRGKVQELEDTDLVWGETKVKDGGDDRGTTEEAKPSVWYQLYAAERDHLVKVCAAAIKAGVEERRVRLAESQGDLVAVVIRRILDDLHLSPQQIELVPIVVPNHLREIALEGTR